MRSILLAASSLEKVRTFLLEITDNELVYPMLFLVTVALCKSLHLVVESSWLVQMLNFESSFFHW
jgi:hypothetical protein